MNPQLTRREWFSTVAAFATWFAAGCRTLPAPKESSLDLRDFYPIDRKPLTDFSGFSGDLPDISHTLFRHPVTKPVLESDEEQSIVVVGGGLSGLFAAYCLRDLNPVILEHHARFGGNAKGLTLPGGVVPMGSAYCVVPDQGSPLEAIFRELDLMKVLEVRQGLEPVLYRGVWDADFWNGSEADLSARKRREFREYLESMREDRDGLRYPEMPSHDPNMRAYLAKLDRHSLREYLDLSPLAPLDPSIDSFVEGYCRSAFGGSAREISAAAGLAFLAAETGPLCSGVGGNAEVAERLVRALEGKIGRENLRSRSAVVAVESADSKVKVTYRDAERRLRRISARAVVLAIPRFVAARILVGIDRSRKELFQSIQYRPYVVAEVQLDAQIPRGASNIHLGQSDRSEPWRAADLMLAGDRRSVMTLFAPQTGAQGRAALFGASEKDIRDAFQNQIDTEILGPLGIPQAKVQGIRIVRWGHSLPLAEPGTYRGRKLERLSEPFHERVFFVSQDNWLLPALETGALEAIHWSDAIRSVLKG